jgi:DNA-binding response OmpR family regulator
MKCSRQATACRPCCWPIACSPQLALLDIGLPDISGWDVCRALRARDYGASMTIYAITAWGGERDHAESREAGFDAHFVKPVNVWSLLERLSDDTSVS